MAAGPLPRNLDLSAIFQLARFRTCFVSVIGFSIGVTVADQQWGWRQATGALVTFLGLAVANVYNAITDLAEDEQNLPGRARLVRSLGEQTLLRLVAVVCALIVIAALASTFLVLLLTTAGLVLLLQYSAAPLRAKNRPIAGILIFSLVVSIPFLGGTLLRPAWWSVPDISPAKVGFFFAYLTLWFCAKGLVKNVPDYYGDKAAGVRTSATAMPSIRSAAVLAAVATIIVYLSLPTVVAGGMPPRVLFAMAWIVPVGLNMLALVRTADRARLNAVLARDMVISVGYLITILLLLNHSTGALALSAICIVIFCLVDALKIDSRAQRHLRDAMPSGS